jgi:uncharacterized protein YijF (DUF1287 family)
VAISRDLNAIFKVIIRQGWRVEQTGKNHFKCYSPDRKTIITTGGTLSDHRAIANIKSYLRRAGALLGMPKLDCAKPILRNGRRVCPVPKKRWHKGR